MRGMNSGSVDLIATDPPFNKGKDFHATPDSLAAGAKFQDRWSWADDVEGDWVDLLKDDWPDVWQVIGAARCSWGDDLGAFLCFMAVRLVEMRRILKPSGSIYLHCDPTASHYLKQLMDAIFGRKQFRNEIVWCYGGAARGAKAVAKHFARNHDVILFYSKSSSGHYHPVFVETEKPDGFQIDKQGRAFKTAPRGDYTDESISRLETQGRVHRTRTGNIRVKYFLTQRDGIVYEDKQVGSVWTDIADMMHAPKSERQGFPTQKPLALYERIIQASAPVGGIVFDPFCGCATTPVAAERLGRQWVGIDIWAGAHQIVLQRLCDEGLAAPTTDTERLFTFGDVTYSAAPPTRTDDGDTAAPYLQVTERVKEPAGPKWTREEMYEHLLAQHGSRCMGCDRAFDDPRYLELDHNTPRSDGGINHVSNRVLLCGPCNRLKSNTFTLSGLRRENKKHGYMTTP